MLTKIKNKNQYYAKLGDKASITVGGDEKTTFGKFVPNVNMSFERKEIDEFFINVNDTSVVIDDELPKDGNPEIQVGDRTDKFYVNDKGQLEYEIIFDKKPASNRINLAIQCSQDLDFWHQGELTQADIDAGCVRLEEAINSYAVYCNKKNNAYKTGKVTHIYRSFVIDRRGTKTWCEQSISVDKGIGTWEITIPEKILNNASLYPLTIGPTLGYTALDGASYIIMTPSVQLAMYIGAMPEAGTLDSVHIGDVDTSSVLGYYCGVYDTNISNDPDNLIFVSDEDTGTSGAQFHETTAGDESLPDGEDLWVVFETEAGNDVEIPYDETGTNYGYQYRTDGSYDGTFPEPFDTLVGMKVEDRVFGVYITYTEAAAGTSIDVTKAEVVIAGHNATVNARTEILSTKAETVISGHNADVKTDTAIACSKAETIIAGHAATINARTEIVATKAETVIAGHNADVKTNTAVSCTKAETIISGHNATIKTDVSFSCTNAEVVIAGHNPAISVSGAIDCTKAEIVIAGHAATVNARTQINATKAEVVISSHAATIKTDFSLSCTKAEVVIAGHNPVVSIAGAIACSKAEVIIAGHNASINARTEIAATKAEVVISGHNASVILGTAINVTTGRVTIAGPNATITAPTEIQATKAEVVIAGHNATVSIEAQINATTGRVSVASHNATIKTDVNIEPTTGVVIIASHNASISTGVVTVTPEKRTYIIPDENRTYIIPDESRIYIT